MKEEEDEPDGIMEEGFQEKYAGKKRINPIIAKIVIAELIHQTNREKLEQMIKDAASMIYAKVEDPNAALYLIELIHQIDSEIDVFDDDDLGWISPSEASRWKFRILEEKETWLKDGTWEINENGTLLVWSDSRKQGLPILVWGKEKEG